MKRKIILMVTVFSLLFSAGGVYIISTIRNTTSELDRLTQMHRAELNKEHSTTLRMTSSKFYEKTDSMIKKISAANRLIFIIVIIVPFMAAGLGYFFLISVTRLIKQLVRVAQNIKEGNPENNIKQIQGEFGELASVLNEMSMTLKTSKRDISEKDKRYQLLFESAADAIFVIEAEGKNIGKIIEANPAAARMHGYTMNELLKLNLIKDLDTPETANIAPRLIKKMLRGEWLKAEVEHFRKDGSIFPAELSSGIHNFMGHKYFLAFYRDISDRKNMENRFIQSKKEWEDTFDEITDMITIHDNNFRIIRANKAAKKILGLPLLNKTDLKCFHSNTRKNFPLDEHPGCDCFFKKAPSTFETYEPHLDKHLEIRAMPRFGKNGYIIGIIHVVRDISKRKKREKTFQRSQQLKLVGEWAAGLAHEIKNPLAGIKATIEMLQSEKNISPDNEPIVMKSVEEIKRIEKLLKSLLNFAKPPKMQLASLNINQLLEQAIEISLKHPMLVRNKATAIQVDKYFNEHTPEITADPMQLQQVFLNLMFNSVEAMPNGGKMSVSSFFNDDAQTITILIRDTGNGMDETTVKNIFQPFFTKKREGTGLGLAITKRLIEDHGGEISVQSSPGRGTEFTILLKVNYENEVL